MSLNIDTFNEILLNAAKDDESKIKILDAELAMTTDLFFAEVMILLDELVDNGYESEQFQKIVNIKNNSERIMKMLYDLKGGDTYDKT